MMPIALTIAGSDSGGGAGIQADLKTFAAHGIFGTSAITAVTAQNTLGVTAVDFLKPTIVEAQIAAVMADLRPSAAKTGMLGNEEIIRAVSAAIREFHIDQLVVDPVMVSKSGHRLLLPEAEAAMRSYMVPLAFIVTPNLPEAEVLLARKITTLDQMKSAARDLCSLGAKQALVKGGHLEGELVPDVFATADELVVLEGERVLTNSTHGTGCTLSAAIAANLAKGLSALDACRDAKTYLAGALKAARPIGQGHGPVEHFWALGSC